MKLKEKWALLNLNAKFTIVISILIVAIVGLLGGIVLVTRKSIQEEQNTDRMYAHVNDLYRMLEINHESKRESIQIALPLAESVFQHAGTLSVDTLPVQETAVNQITGRPREVSFYPLMINEQPLWNEFSIVDEIYSMAQVTATIFQKIDGGFLRVSTNVRNHRGERATGTYIPDSSPVVQALMAGESYVGRAFVVTDYYIAAYKPIFYQGEVVGSIYVGILEKDLAFLASMFLQMQYLQSGYPWMMDREGELLIHPTHQGTNISDTDLFRKIAESHQGMLNYQWPLSANEQESRRLFFRYYEPYDSYVMASVSEYDFLTGSLQDTRKLVFGSLIISLFLVFFTIRYIMSRITTPINQISYLLEQLALGKQAQSYDTHRNDEIGKIAASLNKLIDGLKATAVFANEIEKKNFDHEFTPLSSEDILGNALIDMRQSLLHAEQEELKRKQEDKKRHWATEGLAKFSEILRKDNDRLEVLSFGIIKNLVKYLDINQGGLFIVNDDHEEEKFLELTACYAYDRQKYLTKKVEIGEGLTGTCFLEKQTIYLKQVPRDYINITSGLGEAPPATLLIIPLKLNEEIYGVIELAAFRELEPFEIEFVEKIAESIASTLSSVKINMRTAQLLEQSQQQAEEMRAQEEEMRQNMEELEATQEEIARKSEEQKSKDEEMQQELKQKMEEIRAQEEELRQTVEALEDNQKKMELVQQELSTMVDNMPGIVYQCLADESFTMDYMSDYCEKITGYKASDFIGNKNVAYADLIHPQDIQKVNQAIEQAMKEKTNFYVEYRLRDKDGNYHKVGEHGSLLMDKDGKVHHLQGLVFELSKTDQ